MKKYISKRVNSSSDSIKDHAYTSAAEFVRRVIVNNPGKSTNYEIVVPNKDKKEFWKAFDIIVTIFEINYDIDNEDVDGTQTVYMIYNTN